MRKTKRYPMEFLNFVGDLRITSENMIFENQLDKKLDFVSKYFTPRSSIGDLSRKVLESIHAQEIEASSKKLATGSLGDLLMKGELLKVHPNLTKYMRAILLEVFSLELAVEHQPELGEYINREDINRVRENIKYALDIISVDPRFVQEHTLLFELYVTLGYVEAQVPNMKRDLEGRLDGTL